MIQLNRLFVLVVALACFAFSNGQTPKHMRPLLSSAVPAISEARVVGRPALAQVLHISVALKPKAAELTAFVDSVSDPLSPNYRRFMTPKQVGAAFGASQADVDRVVAYLKSQGMAVTYISPNHMAILAQATVAQTQRAFATDLQTFEGPTPEGGTFTYRAPTGAISVPESIADTILCVGGIDSYARPRKMTTLDPVLSQALYHTAAFYSQGYAGQGCNIAISNWDGYDLGNAASFVNDAQLAVPVGGVTSNIHSVVIGAYNGNSLGEGEADLDIQMELSSAPLAEIYIYDDSFNSPDLLGVLSREAGDDIADIISESYGWRTLSGDYVAACHFQHMVMSAQGQTYLCASGDTGTAGVVDYTYPDSDPDVLVVGGTSANVNTFNGARISEVGWNGSGGGYVATDMGTPNFNLLPSWQHGNGVPTNINRRLFPDVALQAYSGTGAFYIYYDGGLTAFNGTSCAAPWFVGGLAVMEQRLDANGFPHRLGRVNDLIYAENGRAGTWFDVTTGGNGHLPNGSTSSAKTGWDSVTGWGTPNFESWYSLLTIAVQSFTLSTPSVLGGSPVTGTVTLNTPAPSGGMAVALLSSDTTAATVPSSVLVAAGASTANFTITTKLTTTDKSVTITATLNGVPVAKNLLVTTQKVGTVSVTPNPVLGGTTAQGHVTLLSPANASTVVHLTSFAPAFLTVPATVTIPSGQITANFTVTTKPMVGDTNVIVSATIGTSVQQTTVSILAVHLSAFTLSANTAWERSSVTATITLDNPAQAGGAAIQLTSSNSFAANVPLSFTVPQGTKVKTFPIPTKAISTQQVTTITATRGLNAYQQVLTVNPMTIVSVVMTPASVVGGVNASGLVTIGGPAPSGGYLVNLQSSNSAAASVPVSLTIPQGANHATFTVTSHPVAVVASLSITGSHGLMNASGPFQVNPPEVSTFKVSPISVKGGVNVTGTVTLTGKAPVGGMTVVVSANPSLATPAAAVIVPAGATTLNFAIHTTIVASQTVVVLTATTVSVPKTANLTLTH